MGDPLAAVTGSGSLSGAGELVTTEGVGFICQIMETDSHLFFPVCSGRMLDELSALFNPCRFNGLLGDCVLFCGS